MLKTEEFGGGGNGGGNQQTKQLKRQLEATQEDLYKMEKVKSISAEYMSCNLNYMAIALISAIILYHYIGKR